MKSTLKSIVTLVVLVVMILTTVTTSAVAETPMFLTLEEVLAQVSELDFEAICEVTVMDGISYLDVTWSYGMMGYIKLIQIAEEDYVCYNEDVTKMMLCCAAGIPMERDMLMIW